MEDIEDGIENGIEEDIEDGNENVNQDDLEEISYSDIEAGKMTYLKDNSEQLPSKLSDKKKKPDQEKSASSDLKKTIVPRGLSNSKII